MEDIKDTEDDVEPSWEEGLSQCAYCGNLKDPNTVTQEATELYPGACVLCISDFIDFFIQRYENLIKDLPDEKAQIGQFFLNYRDEWRFHSPRVK